MASIRRRENARGAASFAVLFTAYGKQTSETFRGPGAEQAAAKFARLVERIGGEAAKESRSSMSDVTATTPTVAELTTRHIAALSGITEGTRRDYESYVRLSLADTELGRLPFDLVTDEDVSRWVIQLARQGYSTKSIKNRHSLVSATFKRYAKRYRPHQDNPAYGAEIPETETDEPVFLTHGEFALLLGHFDPFWQPFVIGLAGTGLRFGEATALQVRDLHLDDPVPTLTIVRAWKHTDIASEHVLGPPKTKKGRRTIALSPNVVDVLRAQADGKPASQFVFLNRQGRPILHTSWYKRTWVPAVEAATATKTRAGDDIPADRRLTKRPTPHDLRHSHASWLIAQGVPLTEIQYRLGHESIKTTSDLYGHLLPGHLERSAAAMQIALSQALPELEPAE